MKPQQIPFALAACALLVLALGCTSLSAAPKPPTATVQPTSASDNPTVGAIRRATREAEATRSAQQTAAPLATQTAAAAATVNAAATGTLAAQAAATNAAADRATQQALYAAEHTWPQRVSDNFADNHLGWPQGVTQDEYLAVTSTVAGGRYQWLTAIASSGAYTNLAPSQVPTFTDFYAAVNVAFVQGNDESQAAYGLAFRLVDQDFGFFGILKNGQYLLLETHNSNVEQEVLDTSQAIKTGSGATNRLAVVGQGGDFVCLVNDEVVFELGANLAPGQIGLGVEALDTAKPAEVDFTNFEVRAP